MVLTVLCLLFFADVCLKEVPSIADSIYNIQLLKEFSNEYLNKCFYMKPEDMLYSPPVLRVRKKHRKYTKPALKAFLATCGQH